MRFQPLGPRQLRLPFIERPEALGPKFQCAGYMQAVQRSRGQSGTVFACKIGADTESSFGHRSLMKKGCGLVRDESVVDALRRFWRHVSPKLVLRQGVGPFGPVEGSKDEGRCPLYMATCLR